MSKVEKQIRNSLIYMLPLAVNGLLPLITISVFTRFLSKEDFGVWGLALVYAVFASGMAQFGMTTAYGRNFFQYRHDSVKSGQLLYSTIAFVVGNSLLIGTITYWQRNVLAEFIIGSPDHGGILFWAYCGQVIFGLLSYYLAYYKNSERAGEYTLFSVLYSMINLITSLLLIVYFRVGVIGLVYAQCIAGILPFGYLGIKFSRHLRPSFNLEILKESLRISYPLTPRIFIGVISTQFDKYMIGLLASVGGVGIYSIGQRLANTIFSFMTALQNVFSPQVYKRMFDLGEDGGQAVGEYLTPFAYIAIAPALCVALFANEIIAILTPESFHDAGPIISILAMYYGIQFFGKQPQLIYAKKTAMISWLTLFTVALNIGLNIPFIMKWGALGAAWATFLSGFISSAVSFAFSQYYYRIEWEYRKIGAIYFTFLGSVLLLILFRDLSVHYEMQLFVKGCVLILYAFLGVRIGVLSMENIRLVKTAFVK